MFKVGRSSWANNRWFAWTTQSGDDPTVKEETKNLNKDDLKEELSVETKTDKTAIYDAELLMDVDLSKSVEAKFSPELTVENPGEGLLLRPLQLGDYDAGFPQLLGQLTKVGDISREQWEERFFQMKAKQGTYIITVVEDTTTHQVVGASTLVVEQKFIHSCSSVGRVEDVVVSDQYRGRQLGKLVVVIASLLAQKFGCYKVTLNCNDKMVKFYNGLGFRCEDGDANFMVIRL